MNTPATVTRVHTTVVRDRNAALLALMPRAARLERVSPELPPEPGDGADERQRDKNAASTAASAPLGDCQGEQERRQHDDCPGEGDE